MRQVPHELEGLLSAKGRQVLRTPQDVAEAATLWTAMLEPQKVKALGALLSRRAVLERREVPLPPPNTSTVAFTDALPEVMSLSRVRDDAVDALGLRALLTSTSARQLAESIFGVKLGDAAEVEVLSLSAGDSFGPRRGRPGVRLELNLGSSGVKHQVLQHEEGAHFSGLLPVSRVGSVTALRLPLWHATTPLVTRSSRDRRWVLCVQWEPST